MVPMNVARSELGLYYYTLEVGGGLGYTVFTLSVHPHPSVTFGSLNILKRR